ncbi:hypothetical protein [Lunatimonas salinarum]|uniref:hypothetical protein n=1 Tax=Lunatimonas salinarum TaxID=1774590 RepID=UPI001AE04904|nr:hypothetical protein [Lunatimonas salinarum]
MRKLTSILLLIGLASCNLDDNTSGPTNTSVASLTDRVTIASGLRVIQFIEDNEDKTSRYAGFVFRFAADGTVTASRESMEIAGTYRVFRDDGETELAMTFPFNTLLNEFTDDWYFRGETNDRITFEDDYDDDLDRLVFGF